jgi:hypothetical protein
MRLVNRCQACQIGSGSFVLQIVSICLPDRISSIFLAREERTPGKTWKNNNSLSLCVRGRCHHSRRNGLCLAQGRCFKLLEAKYHIMAGQNILLVEL